MDHNHSLPESDIIGPSTARIGAGLSAMVVDDDPLMCELTCGLVEDCGFTVQGFTDPREALRAFGAAPAALVITDWMMPEMDGIALIRALRQQPGGDMAYVILLTTRQDRDDIVAGRAAGADDFLGKLMTTQRLPAHLQSAARILALHRRLTERNAALVKAMGALQQAYDRAQADLATAAQAQRRNLPPPYATLPALRIGAVFIPSAIVSGDTYGYGPVGRDEAYVFAADVAGHGVPAAFQSVTLNRMVRPDITTGLRQPGFSPAAILAELNTRFATEADSDDPYFTMVLMRLGQEDRLDLALAGHPPPLLTRVGDAPTHVDLTGFPVGMLPDATYEDVSLAFRAGDRLAVYSDGVIDCTNRDDVPFGEDRLADLLDSVRDQSVEHATNYIRHHLMSWAGGRALADDVSLLLIERTAR